MTHIKPSWLKPSHSLRTPIRILTFVAGFTLVVMTATTLGVFPYQPAKADVGTLVFTGVGGGPNFSGTGTWEPVGGQPCFNKGKGFRYFIEVFEDLNNDQEFNAGEPVKQAVAPAPCGSVFSGDPNQNLTGGGSWPAVGQTPTPSSFTLPAGAHNMCAVLRHVSPQGNDIVATSCLEEPVVVQGPSPQVNISKTDNKDTANPEDILHYQVTVQETSDEVDAFGVLVTDTLPSGVTNVTNISDGGVLVGNTIQWSLNLTAGETKTLTFDATVDPSLPVGTTILTNTSALSCTEGAIEEFDECPYVGSSIDTTSVTVEQGPFCGDGLVNQTSEQCDGTAGVGANQSCSNGCTLTTLPFCGDGVVNQTSEQCDGTAGVGANQTCTSTCQLQTAPPPPPPAPTLTIAKLDTPDPVADGSQITYTINWSVATTQASGVIITDPLPTNTTFVSATNGGTYDATTNTVSWNLGTVGIGSYSATLVLLISSSVADGTTITNVATIDTNETNPLQASQTTTVKRQDPALSIAKSVNVTFANPGDTVLYTVTVTNTGTDTAHDLVLNDTLPAGFTFVENGKNTITKTFLDTLAVGATASVSYQVTVGANVAAGAFDNLAVVQGSNVGPVSAKAALEVRVPVVLGEEVQKPQVKGEALPETGATALDLLRVGLASLTTLAGVGLLSRRKK